MEDNQTQNGSSKLVWLSVAIVILVVGAVGLSFYMKSNSNKQTDASINKENIDASPLATASPEISPEASVSPEVTVKEFIVTGKSFSFTPNEIKVKRGDTVRIVFINSEGFHDWVMNEFNARTKQIKAGETETIEFIADKVGSFEYYCSVGQHRQMGMVGTLVVEE